MLTKKLYSVVWIVVIVGSFALGMLADTLYAASLSPRAQRGELPDSNSVLAPSSVVIALPREPKENIRGGLAEQYTTREQSPVSAVIIARPAVHTDERLEQALSKYESPNVSGSAVSESLPARGGLAENGRPNLVPLAPKPTYAPHSDGWTDLQLDRYTSTTLFYPGLPDRPAKLRGGSLGD
jgi:hypothetical protein